MILFLLLNNASEYTHSNEDCFNAVCYTKPSAFLFKPFRLNELEFQIQLAIENHREASKSENVIFLTTKGLKKIKLADVMLLEANKSSIYFFLYLYIPLLWRYARILFRKQKDT